MYGGQRDRMTFEEIAKEHCRRMKRKSEVGLNLKLHDLYVFDN